jgi:hypothetical protein
MLTGHPYVGASVLPLILSNFAGGPKNSRSSDINSLSDRELEIFSFIGRGVSVSASDCRAVGNYYNGSAYQTLIERWDGNSWAIVSSPNTSATQNNFLQAVTCVSASECWAVGSYTTGNGVGQTLVLRYTASPTPTPTPTFTPTATPTFTPTPTPTATATPTATPRVTPRPRPTPHPRPSPP